MPWVDPVKGFADIQVLLGAGFILATLVTAWVLRKKSPVAGLDCRIRYAIPHQGKLICT